MFMCLGTCHGPQIGLPACTARHNPLHGTIRCTAQSAARHNPLHGTIRCTAQSAAMQAMHAQFMVHTFSWHNPVAVCNGLALHDRAHPGVRGRRLIWLVHVSASAAEVRASPLRSVLTDLVRFHTCLCFNSSKCHAAMKTVPMHSCTCMRLQGRSMIASVHACSVPPLRVRPSFRLCWQFSDRSHC